MAKIMKAGMKSDFSWLSSAKNILTYTKSTRRRIVDESSCCFFDRDGTINEDPGYLGDVNLVKLFSDAVHLYQF